MNYIRPDYINQIPEEFRYFFSKEAFKNVPYPGTLEQANNFLLFNIFKADKRDIITLVKTDSKGKPTNKMIDFTRDNYYDIFKYNNWKHLSKESKIVSLYWFYEDICDELKIFKPAFYFLRPLPKNYGGYFRSDEYCFVFNLPEDHYDEDGEYMYMTSAYDIIETIAHELKHAQFDQTKQKNYYRKHNKNLYFPMPQAKDYDFTDDYDRFCYFYDFAFYSFQPNELDAYNYGHKKSKEVFDISNFRKTKNGLKLKSDASLTDLRHFRFKAEDIQSDIKRLKNIVGGKGFTDRLDMHNLLNEFIKDAEDMIDVIIANDPNVEVDDSDIENIKITLSKDANQKAKDAVKKYLELIEQIDAINLEIDKDRKKLFKKYKEIIAKAEIQEYEDIFTK